MASSMGGGYRALWLSCGLLLGLGATSCQDNKLTCVRCSTNDNCEPGKVCHLHYCVQNESDATRCPLVVDSSSASSGSSGSSSSSSSTASSTSSAASTSTSTGTSTSSTST